MMLVSNRTRRGELAHARCLSPSVPPSSRALSLFGPHRFIVDLEIARPECPHAFPAHATSAGGTSGVRAPSSDLVGAGLERREEVRDRARDDALAVVQTRIAAATATAAAAGGSVATGHGEGLTVARARVEGVEERHEEKGPKERGTQPQGSEASKRTTPIRSRGGRVAAGVGSATPRRAQLRACVRVGEGEHGPGSVGHE